MSPRVEVSREGGRLLHLGKLHLNICDGICDSCDLCGITTCEFYDTSPEATRRFIRGLNYEQSAEFQFAKPN